MRDRAAAVTLAVVAHGEAVVLGGDLDLAGAQVLDRVVGAAVAELELERAPAQGQGEQLVAEADAEDGHLAEEPRTVLTTYVTAAGSPGPFERKTPSGCELSTSRALVRAGSTVTRMPRAAR